MMKTELPCAIVGDLLPSYVEGLTCDETSRAVEAHLAFCPACAARRDAMTAPEEAAEADLAVREVDYLKKVKSRNRRRVATAVLCTALVLLASFAAKLFIIGTPAQEGELIAVSSQEENGVLRLSISTPYSATAYRGWTVDTTDGVAVIRARSVLVSPLFSDGGGTVEVPLEGIREVRLCGRIVWQDGVAIRHEVSRLYETRTPYVGDMPALNRVANALNIADRCGAYTNSLQTSGHPYGWTLEFSGVYTEEKARQLDEVMETVLAPQMLALVGNLEQVSWTYSVTAGTSPDPEPRARTVTLEEASADLPGSVKDYADSPADFQRLTELLG